MLIFEHVNFSINGKYSKKHYDIPNYYVSLVIFQMYKNSILRSVDSLGCSFECVFTHFEFSKLNSMFLKLWMLF
jgi:hypothetical protein